MNLTKSQAYDLRDIFESHSRLFVNDREVDVVRVDRVTGINPERYEMMTNVRMNDGSFFQFWIDANTDTGGLWYFGKPSINFFFLKSFFRPSPLDSISTLNKIQEIIFKR